MVHTTRAIAEAAQAAMLMAMVSLQLKDGILFRVWELPHRTLIFLSIS